ncbi:MAG: ArsA family ATPase [Desulfatibacillum sp.]|nr:ArsA family ATPase [Desulfatibacillum sp.]
MRIIFFAGKGGVGKTSVSAATGIRSALAGKRTIVMSLDTAHSLSDVFDLDRSLLDQNKGDPVKVSENLWIQEVDIQEEIKKNWASIYEYIAELLATTGVEEILAEELAILPGMEELSLLMHINRYVRENEYDVIILDSAPTGESIRFISIPTTLEWYMKKLFKVERTVAKYIRPLAKRVVDIPLPDDNYFAAIKALFQRLEGVNTILEDPEITTVRMVCNPEKIVLKETQRGFMYFSLYKMHVDAIVMNRVLPESITDVYFTKWKEKQAGYLQYARELFAPVPIFPVDLFAGEVLGYEALKNLADKVYGEKDPLTRFYDTKPYQLTKVGNNYKICFFLPFLDKGNVEINRSEDELIVRLGSFKRHVLLPRHVAAKSGVRAKVEEQNLCVYFEDEENG